MADVNNRNWLSSGEWNEFAQMFIIPFEKCWSDKKSYILKKENLKKCFENEPSSSHIAVRPHQKEKMFERIITSLSNNHDEEGLNVYSYIILRKAMYAWAKCHSDIAFMSLNAFKCATGTINSFNIISPVDIETIYNYALNKWSSDIGNAQLDFLSFVRVTNYLNAYVSFGANKTQFWLEKKTFIKRALDEDSIQNNYDKTEINFWYDFIATPQNKNGEHMDFINFASFYNTKRLFNSYAKERTRFISIDEAVKTWDDLMANYVVGEAIDKSFTNFKKENYVGFATRNTKIRYNEDKFFNFKQDSSEHPSSYNKKGLAFKMDMNAENRKIYFKAFSGTNPGFVSKEEFYISYAFGELFASFIRKNNFNQSKYTVSLTDLIRQLPAMYDSNTPIIGLKHRFGSSVYKQMPATLDIDILVFAAVEAFEGKTTHNQKIDKVLLEKILSDYGMKEMPSDIYVRSLSLVDPIGRQMYEPNPLIAQIASAQAMCSESKRDEMMKKEYGISEKK